MSATNTSTHFFFEGKPRLTGKVGAGGVASTGATTIPHTFVGLDEGDAYIVTANRTDATGTTKNSASQTETFIGKVSSTNFINCVRAVEGTAQAWAADTVLEILFSATGWNKLIEGIELEHNQDGTHKSALVTTLKASGAVVNTGTSDLTIVTPKALADSYLGGATSNLQTQISALPTASSTTTLTNKRITKRVVTTTDDATAVIDTDITDGYQLSAVANATEFTLTGTPTDGQILIVRYKDAGVSKALTWTGFTPIGTTLPTATTAGKWGYVGCKYNSAASAWHVLAVQTQA